jgi:nucleotide-binding universal stress UspA family protein
LATDLSSHSEATTGYAGHLLEDGAEVTTITIVGDWFVPMGPDFAPSSPMITEFRNQSVKRASDSLEEICKRHLAGKCERKEAVPSSDPAAKAICEYAKKNGNDLIVIGSHGAGRLQSLFLGTTAQRILKLAPCPVLVIPEKAVAETPRKITKAIIATDLSDASLGAIKAVSKCIAGNGIEITLASILPSWKFLDQEPEMMAKASSIFEYLEQRVPQAESHLAQVGAKHFSGLPLATKVIESDKKVAEALYEYAISTNADCIVIGSHGAGVLGNLFIGSTVLDLLKMAALPVLVVPVGKSPND